MAEVDEATARGGPPAPVGATEAEWETNGE